jgi:hypothetical protein
VRVIGLIIILFTISSCENKEMKNTFEPQTKKGDQSFSLDEFSLITAQDTSDFYFWNYMNHADVEIGVFKDKNGIKLNSPQFDYPYCFNLDDGKLEVKNRGEFGGEFNFIPSDRSKDTVRILDINVIYIFQFENEIYFLAGIAHMMDQGGAIVKLIREGDEFKFEEILQLDSSPEAMTIYNDKILIAGNQNFTVIKDFKKEYTLKTNWGALYPNSVVATDYETAYIGFRGGYAKISLTSKKIDYFKHKTVKKGV